MYVISHYMACSIS